MEDEKGSAPMEDDVPYLEMVVTQGYMTMAIKAHVSKLRNAGFTFCFIHLDEGEDEDPDNDDVADDFNFLYPLKDDEDGSLLLREFLSDMVSRISCSRISCCKEDDAKNMTVPSTWRKTYCKHSSKNTTILRTWRETLCFLMHYAFRQMLRDSAFLGICRGASFFVEFCLRLPSTMSDWPEAARSLAGPGNLLRRHELDKDDRSRGSCAVCLEEFEGGDDLTRLPCSHIFHCRCLAEWLLPKGRTCPRTCPLCRYKMGWLIIPFALGARLRMKGF